MTPPEEKEVEELERRIEELKLDNESVLHLDRYDKDRRKVLDKNSQEIAKLKKEVEALRRNSEKKVSVEDLFNIVRREKWFTQSKIATHNDIYDSCQAIADYVNGGKG